MRVADFMVRMDSTNCCPAAKGLCMRHAFTFVKRYASISSVLCLNINKHGLQGYV